MLRNALKCSRLVALVAASAVSLSLISGVYAAEAEHEGGAASHAAANPAASNPLSIDVDLAIVTLLIFACLMAVLWKFAWGPIATALEKREQNIADNIAAAQQTHEDAKHLLAHYEQKMAGAAGEIRELLDTARRDAERSKAEILTEAKAASHAEQARATREIRTAADQALAELAQKSADVAVDLAGKIVGSQLKASDHMRLVQDAVSNFAKASNN